MSRHPVDDSPREASRSGIPSGHHFRALVENASDIIARYDRDLRHVYINPAVERFTGRPPEDFIGKTSRETGVLQGEFAEAWTRAIRAAFEEGREQRGEFEIARPEGSLWTDTRFVPEFAEDGSVRSVLEVTRDITARKNAEAELRRTADRLQAVLDASPLAVIGFDLDGRVTTWNPAAEDIFGWAAEEIVGSPLPRVLDASWERMKDVFARVLEGETVTGFEVEVRTRTLRRVVVSVSAASLHSGPGPGVTGILAVVADVTAQKRVEEERRRLTAILEASPDFVGATDAEGNVLWVNDAGKQMVGMDPDEPVKGMSITSFHPPSVAIRIMKELLPAVAEAGVRRDETLLQHRDGSEIPVSLVAIAHRDEGGDLGFRSIVARDLRARKALEAQLRQSQRMEAVGRLAGGVAHEFNNVLTMLQGHADLALLEDDLPDELRGDLEMIREGIGRAAGLTRQLTAFARRQQSRPRIVDLGEVVRQAEPALRPVAGDGVELRVEVEGEDHPVEVDPAQIEQALVAMTLNARDAMPRGGSLFIRVRGEWVEGGDPGEEPPLEAGPYVALQVADTGEGMAVATRERAFEPFFTTRDPSHYSGLGLSGVYGIVRQNRGRVTVESEPGDGTTFTLLFPVADDVEAEESGPEES